MDENDLKGLVARAVAEHEGPLLRYACSLCRDTEMARDAVQDTFIKLWQEGSRQVPERLAPWLFKVCRNRVFEIMRRERRMISMEPTDVPVTDQEPSPDQALAETERSQALAGLVARLPSREQELVRLKFQNGLSYQEISQITGLSVSNVGFILHTAMKSLRQRLVLAHGN